MTEGKPLVAISACLLGEVVRYDGGHKRNDWCADYLADRVQLLPLCPEVAIGLGVPRQKIDLHRIDGQLHALSASPDVIDLTEPLTYQASLNWMQLANRLSGYIFMQRSPSCGLTGVRWIDEQGVEQNDGQGVYAGEFFQHWPQLPVIESWQLDSSDAVDKFIAQVRQFAGHVSRWPSDHSS